jgi:OOP family OmpA-OmpF porin
MLQPKKWWIGLPIVAGLGYFATSLETPSIESDISRRLSAKLAGTEDAIDGPQVSVNGRDATLSGVAIDEDLKRQALADLRNIAGVRLVADATMALAPAKPFTVSFERHGGKIVLSGHLPTKSAREKIKTAIAALGAELSDSSALAAGAPNNFAELADFVLAQLAKLDPGKAALADNKFTLTGEAKTVADYDDVFAAAKSAPAGISVAALDVSPPRVTPYVWSAANIGEMVALTGSIPSNDLRAKIVAKAASISSGSAVSDAMQIGAGVPAGDFESAVSFALLELGKLAQGKAVLTDSKLAIEGRGRENIASATIEADAKANLPQGFELAKIEIDAGPVSPYVFSARKSNGAVTLSGYALDETQKDKILGAAKRQFFEAAVVDQIAIAKGAPANFADAAVAALRALARLEDGKLDLSGSGVSLDGRAYYPKAAADIDAKLAAALPQNFKNETHLLGRTPGSNLPAGECQTLLSERMSKANILFDANDSIADDSAPLLDVIAATVLRCQDSMIEVGAHTDSLGIAEVNRDVSKRRSQAVVDYLIKAGADPFKLSAVGYGGERPVATNDNDEDRARNRRIEFLVK